MNENKLHYRRGFVGIVATTVITATAGCQDLLYDEEHKYENKAQIVLTNSYYENETTTFEFTARAENGTVIYEDKREVTKSIHLSPTRSPMRSVLSSTEPMTVQTVSFLYLPNRNVHHIRAFPGESSFTMEMSGR